MYAFRQNWVWENLVRLKMQRDIRTTHTGIHRRHAQISKLVEKHRQSSAWAWPHAFDGQAYVKPILSYSNCAMDKGIWKGWNVKYKKSGKALCTLYPKQGYFQALVVIGAKESADLLTYHLTLKALSTSVLAEKPDVKPASVIMIGFWISESNV